MSETAGSWAARLRGATAQLPYLPKALQLVWYAARGWSLLWVGLLVVQGLLPAVMVYLTKALVNSLVAVVSSHGNPATVGPTVMLALTMGITMLLTQLLGTATGWVRSVQSELVADHITTLVHGQSVKLDLSFYDTPDYYDHLHRARWQAAFRPIGVLESMGGLLQNAITMMAMAAVLLPYGLWVPLALVISTLPALWVVLRYRAREHDWQVSNTASERRIWYYDWLLSEREAAAELRLFGLAEHFESAHKTLRRHLRDQRLRLDRQEGVARLAASSLALLVTGIAMAWMAWRALQGLANLGDLALFYSAFNQGQGLMRSALENLGQIYSNSLFLGDLFTFLYLEPQVVDPANPQPYPSEPPALASPATGRATTPATQATVQGPHIRFRNVAFRYPGGTRMVLEDLNLEIAAGQIIAVVGPNGAGKSTLIKLLCRFYDPLSGTVEVNGVDLRKLSLEELRQHISVLFQDPVQYNTTAAENIAIANGAHVPAEIHAAAQAAGADGPIERLPHGYDTLLGTWFEGGTDLSVGEWQRIALARSFLRQAPIVILDEPTSAMDAWAEADWLARFRTLVAGRTAIIITHRFTTARYADKIYVLDRGRVIESGNHEALVGLDGQYAEAWHAQQRADAVPVGPS
jgi:ATP-binding cassette subfamily B protein